MVHYGLNKIKLAFDAQNEIVIDYLLYLLTCSFSNFSLGVEGHLCGLGLELNSAGLEPSLTK